MSAFDRSKSCFVDRQLRPIVNGLVVHTHDEGAVVKIDDEEHVITGNGYLVDQRRSEIHCTADSSRRLWAEAERQNREGSR